MSLAWKVERHGRPLRSRRGRGRDPRDRSPRHSPDGRVHLARTRPARERDPADGGDLRIGKPSGLGLVPGPVPSGGVGAHDGVPGARAHPDQRDHLPVRLGQPAAQPADSARSPAPTGTSPPSTAGRSGFSMPTSGTAPAHTFSIPSLGISVPLFGNNGNANLCGAAPCTTSSPHQVIRFSFNSPGPGSYRWQCFVPCGTDFLFGNGGPMSTLGYMGGFMKVVA